MRTLVEPAAEEVLDPFRSTRGWPVAAVVSPPGRLVVGLVGAVLASMVLPSLVASNRSSAFA